MKVQIYINICTGGNPVINQSGVCQKDQITPTTKADLLEFLTTMQANMLNTSAYKIESAAYFSKYTEALLKSSTLFKKDSLFSSFIENKDSTIKEYNKKREK